MRLPVLNAGLAGFALIFLTAAAAPQTATPPPAHSYDQSPPEVVVVTGHRPAVEKVHDVVWNYVYARAGYSPKIDQLTRWITPICPEVRNLTPGFRDFIVARIKAIAGRVGAPVGDKCKLNVEIIFTATPQVLMDQVASNSPVLLGYHFVHATDDAAKVDAPIQAWYVTSTSNGTETFRDDPYHGTPGGMAGTRFSHGLMSVFSHILIIANTDVLVGRPIGPVADYLAVLALSQSKGHDDCNQLPSILDLLSPNCSDDDRPASLTIADKAYLEGLYASNKMLIGSLERSSISEHMIKSLGGE